MAPDEDGAVGTQPDVGGLLTTLKESLTQMSAPDVAVIRDFQGNEYRLQGAMPARRQIQAFREILQFLEAGKNALTGADLNGLGLLKVIGQLLTDEEAVGHLGRSFSIAYPEVVKGQDPLDVFPFEEIIAGLMPMLMRFAKRSGMALAEVAT